MISYSITAKSKFFPLILLLSLFQIIFLFQLSAQERRNFSEEEVAVIFEKLDSHRDPRGWGWNNSELAEIFKNIYSENISNDIDNLILEYCSDRESCYWIGYFLCSSFYTDIGNNDLAIAVFKKGLDLCENEYETVSFYWTIGHQLVIAGREDEAKSYLLTALDLSAKYPGCRPARIQEETEIVNAFLDTIQ